MGCGSSTGNTVNPKKERAEISVTMNTDIKEMNDTGPVENTNEKSTGKNDTKETATEMVPQDQTITMKNINESNGIEKIDTVENDAKEKAGTDNLEKAAMETNDIEDHGIFMG
ncbi:hypothetical protein ACJMK2_018107 [Sinanodonta woodiana]|uniref:Uncharacterized protein n=1 Tax=Sinanodonta woodiana TaxID=1069815 RepID=A0ABD3UCE1_SINWO